MSIGEVVSALVLCATSLDDDKDCWLMLRDTCKIEVHDDYILVYFFDPNAPTIKVYKDGKCKWLC